MSRFVEHLKTLAAALSNFGGPGLALLTFLDSSILPLPEIPDFALCGLVIQHPDRWPYYAAMATLGSLAGCYILFTIGRKGGHAILAKYVHAKRIDSGMAAFRKYGLLTVVVPSILPPPMPFKPFVLFAGVAQVSPAMFVGAVLIGRGFRYGGEAFLAYLYGAPAMDYLEHNIKVLSLWFALAVAVIGFGVILWRRRNSRRPS